MWYWLFKIITIIILKVFFRIKVYGRNNIPKNNNFIVVANHNSFLDPFIVGSVIPQKIHWVAQRNFYKVVWMRWFLMKTETLQNESASEKAISLLKRNKNVGLFPEGSLNDNGKLKPFRRGAALLAFKTGRPILPCAILGAAQALPLRAKFPRFIPIQVKIGEPIFLLKEFEEVIDDILLQEGILKMKNAICELLEPDN